MRPSDVTERAWGGRRRRAASAVARAARADADAARLATLASIYEPGYAVDALLSTGTVLVAPVT